MGSQSREVRVEVRAHASAPAPAAREAAPGEPFRILVLADLSGRASVGTCVPDLGTRKCLPIDRDTFEDVFQKLAPRLRIGLGAAAAVAVDVSFAGPDDFHPDALFGRVDVFARLRALRDRLLDPRSSAAAIAECMAAGMATARPLARPEPAAGGPAEPRPAAGLLEDALRATAAARGATPAGSSLVDRLVRELVAPHSVPRPDPRQADLVADVERAIGEQMRALLAAPAFRDLEGAWLGLQLLTHRLETDRQLSIHVLDVSREELAASLPDGSEPLRSGLGKQLIDATIAVPGGVPFACVVGAYSFGDTREDVALLARIAEVCAKCGSVFAAAAAPRLFGCPGFAASPDPDDWHLPVDPAVLEAWNALRARPEAAWVGLVAPRFLMRLPYGRQSSPTATFAFEEETPQAAHDELLWGNGAFLLALVIAEAFRENGWGMRLGAPDEVAGLPLHVHRVDGEATVVPIAEIELTSRGAEHMGRSGIIPLFTVRGTDAVRFGSFRSIAAHGAPLAGRWHAS